MASAVLVAGLLQGLLRVAGVVVDGDGLPLPNAAVVLQVDGQAVADAVTDADGRFARPVPAAGALALAVSLEGFEPATRTFERGDPHPLRIVLRPARREERVVVRAPVPANASARFELAALDVVRTPGTQADLFRFVQMLPGVVHVDEGAGLYVRGGDVSETAVLIDGVAMAHPYRYESPTGGWTGSVDAFQLDGASFEQGAFPARYGHALSGVLDLRTLGRPGRRELTMTAGLAGAALSLAQPVGNRGGLRVSANRTWTRLLFAVNGSPQQFDREPDGWDGRVSAHVDAGRAGHLKVAVYGQGDRVGVETPRDAFRGFLHSAGSQRAGSLVWEMAPPPATVVRVALGHDRYRRTTDVGVLALTTTDRTSTMRADLEHREGAATWRAGVHVRPVSTRTEGQKSIRGGDFDGVSGVIDFAADVRATQASLYAEAERPVWAWTVNGGVRIDRFSKERTTAIDPRVSAALAVTSRQRLRLAWGRYHQAPRPDYYDAFRGAGRLEPLRAAHYVAGYEWGGDRDVEHVRLELYYKRYGHLPVERHGGGYESTGHGRAAGLDLFARRGGERWTLRGTYSFLHARRRWTPSDQFQRYALPAAAWRPDFEIPQAWSVVGDVTVADGVSLAASWRHASGRPFTPIVGATPGDSGPTPVFGPINSDRLPSYDRLDVSASVSRPLGRGLAVLFGGVSNVTGRRNGFEYSYAPDFQSRALVVSSTPRAVYVGVSLIH